MKVENNQVIKSSHPNKRKAIKRVPLNGNISRSDIQRVRNSAVVLKSHFKFTVGVLISLLVFTLGGLIYLSSIILDQKNSKVELAKKFAAENQNLKETLNFTLDELHQKRSSAKDNLIHQLESLQQRQNEMQRHHELLLDIINEQQVRAIIRRTGSQKVMQHFAKLTNTDAASQLANNGRIVIAQMLPVPLDIEGKIKRIFASGSGDTIELNSQDDLRAYIKTAQYQIDELAANQKAVLGTLAATVDSYVTKKTARLARFGVRDPKRNPSILSAANIGGPFIAADATSDSYFAENIDKIDFALARLDFINGEARRVPLGSPVVGAKISSPFGFRRDPFIGRRSHHAGIDFKAKTGTPVKVTASGIVTKAGWSGGYGRLVEVRHRNGVTTRYAHLRTITAKVGQKVARGTMIGKVGSSGRSTGPHLHYEIRKSGRPVNPRAYVLSR